MHYQQTCCSFKTDNSLSFVKFVSIFIELKRTLTQIRTDKALQNNAFIQFDFYYSSINEECFVVK